MSDIEKEIWAKGLTAPRVTKQEINELLDRVTYSFDVRPNGSTTTLVHAFLDGDFYLATGVSACVSVENFNADLGLRIATSNAKAAAEKKLWELEGYALRKRLAGDEISVAILHLSEEDKAALMKAVEGACKGCAHHEPAAAPEVNPTHRCKVCGALWKLWKDGEGHPKVTAGWNLRSEKCGPCCDNVEIGDQIEELPAEGGAA